MPSLESSAGLISMFIASTGAYSWLRVGHRWMPKASPRDHRAEKFSVPLIGGPVIAFATLVSHLLLTGHLSILLSSAMAILFLGIFDDRFEFRASTKLPFEILAAALWVQLLPAGQITFTAWPMPPLLAEAIAVFWIVGLTNALNLSDGVDGLAASIAGIAFACIAFAGTTPFRLEAVLLLGAIAAFLPFNFSRSRKIYLGDAGSLFIGFSLACILSTTSWNGGVSAQNAIVSMLLVSYPQFDTIHSIFRRLFAGRRVMDGDQEHIHHRFVALGLTHAQTTLSIAGIAALVACSLVSIGSGRSSWTDFALLAAGVLLCLFLVLRLHKFVRGSQQEWAAAYLQARYGGVGSNASGVLLTISAPKLIQRLPRINVEAIESLCASLPGSSDTLQSIVGRPLYLENRFLWLVPEEKEAQVLFSLKDFLERSGLTLEEVAYQRTAHRERSTASAIGY